MEANTVILQTKEYNRLRDFYKGIQEDKFVQVYSNYFHESEIFYRTEKEVVMRLKQRNEALKKELDKLKNPKEKNLEQVKNMSLWEFIKWRKNNNNQ
tara:strand:- start:225 stop:515 length:291 start_codon:yes stop_codon:yes gene_type:complete